MNENKTINWYPGHMAKTKREIKDALSLIDVVVEIVDSRVPNSSHINDLDSFIKDKKILIIFNKYDLCDEYETSKWINYYENLGFSVLTCNSKENTDVKKIISFINKLMNIENEKRKKKGLMPKKPKVLVVGVPNAGKSTFINRLVNKKINEVGNRPGITKSLKTIRIGDIDLVDTPGILWPKIESEEVALNLASMSIIKEEILPLDKVAVHILGKLYENYKEIFKREFGFDNYDSDNLMYAYEMISKNNNFKLIDDEPDYEKINIYILNLIKKEKIKNITFDRICN